MTMAKKDDRGVERASWQQVYDALIKMGMEPSLAHQRADDYIGLPLKWEKVQGKSDDGHTTSPELKPRNGVK